MKKISFLLIVLLPFLAFSQGLNVPSVLVKTLDEKYVRASELVKDNQSVLIYFFNENSPDVLNQFYYLEILNENEEFCRDLKIIAIYNASNGAYGYVKPFLYGNDINVETYIDINGELQRAMGLSGISMMLLSGTEEQTIGRYSGLQTCSGELISLVDTFNTDDKSDNKNDRATWTGDILLGN